jgi:hypothetical protein
MIRALHARTSARCAHGFFGRCLCRLLSIQTPPRYSLNCRRRTFQRGSQALPALCLFLPATVFCSVMAVAVN